MFDSITRRTIYERGINAEAPSCASIEALPCISRVKSAGEYCRANYSGKRRHSSPRPGNSLRAARRCVRFAASRFLGTDTVFRDRDLFSSVSLEDTRSRVTLAFALFARMRLLRPYTPHSCDHEYQIRDGTFQEELLLVIRFLNDVPK